MQMNFLHEAYVEKVTEISAIQGLSFLSDLAGRWHDEKTYEDFEDYKKVISEKFKDFKIKKINKRPFGLTIELTEGYNLRVKVQLSKTKAAIVLCEIMQSK